ncbi:MAG: M16 family metallopeptidase [Thermodesulfobacteriota bacterium]
MNFNQSLSLFTPPQIFSYQLPQGLRVCLVNKPHLPLLSMHLVLPYGAEADFPGKAGLADLTAEMLTLGTKKRSALQLAADIDSFGAILSAHAGWDYTSLHISGLQEDWETLLAILLEIYTEPAFSREEFAQMKKRRLAALEQRKDESPIVADEHFQTAIFQGTPYDHPVYGSLSSLPQIFGEDIKEFHAQNFLPQGSFLVFVGSLEEEKLLRWVEGNFPAVKDRSWANGEESKYAYLSAKKIILIDRPDLTQSQIRLGHLSLPHNHPDYLPLAVMNYILGGGGFSSRLMQRIRVELGYTYGIRSGLEPRKNKGPFLISTFTPTETTYACVQEILGVEKKFLQEGATEEERSEAINFFIGSYPMKFETLGQIAQKVIQREVHDLEEDYWLNYPKRIANISLAEINRVAREYLHPEEMVLVIVGRVKKFRPEFEQWGEIQLLD